MSKFTRISAALALVLAIVSSGCKSNNCCNSGGAPAGDCGCGSPGGAPVSGIPAGAITTTPAPSGMISTTPAQGIGSSMGGSSTYTPTTSSGGRIMGGGTGSGMGSSMGSSMGGGLGNGFGTNR
jgi:hypothetical protein